jgi:hypothetical protein
MKNVPDIQKALPRITMRAGLFYFVLKTKKGDDVWRKRR